LLTGAILFWIVYLLPVFLPESLLNYALYLVVSLAVAAGVAALLTGLLRWMGRAPRVLLWSLCLVLILFVPVMLGELALAAGLVAGLVAFAAVWTGLGFALVALARRGPARAWRILSVAVVLAVVALNAAALNYLLTEGAPRSPVANAAQPGQSTLPKVPADPAAPGQYAVSRFSYGPSHPAGQRAAEAFYTTAVVDGRAWVKEWSAARTRYFGFGSDALPLAAQVWQPQGAGPFPLAVVLHGNHRMETRSELGYAYLCEQLASRGIVCASLDENFFNASSWTGGAYLRDRGAGIDARAWLLLEHLRAWRAWNRQAGHPLFGLIDESRIALIGHSLGGEAVALATALNDLPAHPDDATRRLDFGFGIRSVVALAPTDSIERLAGKRVRLKDVDYLALHGSHDMDVMAFQGQNQLERLDWTDGERHFSAGVYLYGANHGQFNTVWGRRDKDDLLFGLMNTRQIMPAGDQQEAARAYVTAFLEATLNGRDEYLNFVRDARTSPVRRPDLVALSQVHESPAHYVATFEEDVDVTTATLPGAAITGQNLSAWREDLAPLKLDAVNTGVAYLGWSGSTRPATYTITLSEVFTPDAGATLVFSLAHRRGIPADSTSQPLDLTVELVDRAGNAARLPLSHFAFLQPEIRVQLAKAGWMTRTVPPAHPVFQTFHFPLAHFAAANAAFDPAAIRSMSLVFDRTPAGLVLLDEVGFRPTGD
jgi:dienelactone hydrolase